ncbi:MAG: LamG domain-containing protein [Pirellulales bacterium]|nr:LamG domain-containing protein [Pirellulales bacterium]
MKFHQLIGLCTAVLLMTGFCSLANADYITTLNGMSGLVSNWHLEEMSGNAADSVPGDGLDNDNPGTYYGTHYTQGVDGPTPSNSIYQGMPANNKAVYFADNSDTRLQMATHSVFGGMEDISLITWVQYPSIPGSNSDRRCVGGLQANASNRYVTASCLYNPGANGTGLQGYVTQSDGTGSNMDRFDNGINLWHMWVVTYEDGNHAKVYLNGVEKDSWDFAATLGLYTPDGLIFGNDISTSVNRPWKGEIDEIAIFDRALSGTEIANLYQEALVPEPSTVLMLVLAGLALAASRLHRG